MKASERAAVFCFLCLALSLLYLITVTDTRWTQKIVQQNGSGVNEDSDYRMIHTDKFIDEYCIAYNFLEATETFRQDSLEPITLALHGTSDMLKSLEKKPANWDGPISLGLFIDFHSQSALEYISEVHRCDAKFREQVTVHFAFRILPYQTTCNEIMIPFSNRSCKNFLANRKKIRESITSSFQLYPINVMRNIARRGAKSDIHFIADGDMVMSEGFAIKAKNIANQMIDGKSKDVLVVRRFETKGPNIPKDHVELAWSVQNKTVFEFHHKFFFKGHKIENLTYWLDRSSEKLPEVSCWPISYAGVFWEVQVILHRNDLYNADYFPARIRDMQTLIYSLCRANYTFHLLSHVFNVHEGVKTADTTYSKAVVAHQKAFVKNKAFNRFNQELNAMYPHTFAKCGNFTL